MGKELARTFPPGALDMAHAINCELPKRRIGTLIGTKGARVDQIEKDTGAHISVADPPPGKEQEHRTMNITGPLISVYAAHMMMMRQYHEAERKEQDREREERERRNNGGLSDRKVDELQSQLAALQRQLEDARRGGGGGGGG